MPFYRTKPQVIEAIQWDGKEETFKELNIRFSKNINFNSYEPILVKDDDSIFMKPLTKSVDVRYIRKGEFLTFVNNKITVVTEGAFLYTFETIV